MEQDTEQESCQHLNRARGYGLGQQRPLEQSKHSHLGDLNERLDWSHRTGVALVDLVRKRGRINPYSRVKGQVVLQKEICKILFMFEENAY